MPFIPYSRQDITQADVDAVISALRSDYLTQGPRIEQFEQEFARQHEVEHAVAVANATAGLHIACLAMGVGPGSRVWTTPNSFVASANAALYCGAKVDFVDIDPRTRNMSVPALQTKLELARQRGTLPQVVVPVDFSGLPCDLREIRSLAERFGFKILEDASHATGAEYLGRPLGGGFADVAVFSFHAVKIVTTAEGGMVTTQDARIAAALRALRSHGITRDSAEMEAADAGGWYYEQRALGFNYRMTDVQAALGLSQLRRLPQMRKQREELADRYDHLLADLPVIVPARELDRLSAWHLYVVEIDDSRTRVSRRAVFDQLRKAGIGVNVHYIPIHTQPFYRGLGFQEGDFPHSEDYYSRALTIPLFPALTHDEQDHVVGELRLALGA